MMNDRAVIRKCFPVFHELVRRKSGSRIATFAGLQKVVEPSFTPLSQSVDALGAIRLPAASARPRLKFHCLSVLVGGTETKLVAFSVLNMWNRKPIRK